MTAVWFSVNFWSACAVSSFAYYVFEERGWQPEDLQLLVPAAVPFSFAGYALSGWLMDRIGRRPAASLYLALGSLAGVVCYQSTNDVAIGAAYIGIQMLNGIWPIAQTLAAELFPTSIRGDANGASHNLLGRWGLVIAPAAVGWLAGSLGTTADAVSFLVLGNLLCIPVVVIFMPETRGIDLRTLDEADAEVAS
jgi:putative MFS transporter